MVQRGVVAIIKTCNQVLGLHASATEGVMSFSKALNLVLVNTEKDVNKELCRDIIVKLLKAV